MSEKELFEKLELFDSSKDFAYTEEARELCQEVFHALRPIYEKWGDKGYSPRDIMHIIVCESMSACFSKIVRMRKTRKDAEKAKNEP